MAFAAIELKVEKMDLDGLVIQDLHCTLPQDHTMAALHIGAAISKIKLDLDSCIPNGGVAQILWNWPSKEGSTEILAISNEDAKLCVSEKAQKVKSPFKGRCKAILLIGKREEAEKAKNLLFP